MSARALALCAFSVHAASEYPLPHGRVFGADSSVIMHTANAVSADSLPYVSVLLIM